MNLKQIILSSRPISWVNTAYPFFAGYLFATGGFNWLLVIVTLYFLVPYNLLMYGLNDIFDYESDIRNPRKGGIEGAILNKKLHKTVFWVAIASNLPFILALFFMGDLLSNFTLVVLLFFVIAYSVPGLRFKERPILDSITSSIHFVGPLVYAAILVGDFTEFLPFIIAFFLWGVASHAFGAVQDILPDRQAKIASIATVFGAKNTVRLVVAFYALAAFLTIIQGGLAIVVGLVSLIYLFNALPFVNLSDKSSESANRGWRRFIWLNMLTGAVITVILLYSVSGL
ncbi:MAG TPA: prenyltransferase [Candidatus Saccharimonadales bacterium]|nr:prenyltransferase [Candidatus Saccharimonadales bacterium]